MKREEKRPEICIFFLEWLQFDDRLGGCPCILQILVFGLSWHLFRAFSLPLPLTSFFFLPPCPFGWPALSWAGLPSILGFKPLRASFPSSKSFKAECVWKAVFFGGEGSEPDRNRYESRSGRMALTFTCLLR